MSFPAPYVQPDVKKMLYDARPGDRIYDVAEYVVVHDLQGFVFNEVIVRRLFGETRHELYLKYQRGLKK